MRRIALFLGACLFFITASVAFVTIAAHAADVPYLSGRITDNAELLGAATKQKLNTLLKAHEVKTGNQIAVLTINSLEGESVEEYALTVFNTWKLGQKGKDNGVLLLVVLNERRMCIEVGYGLEGTLTDVAASRIIRNVMTPHFKEGDYEAGIAAGVQAVIDHIAGTATLPPDPPTSPNSSSDGEQESGSLFDGPDLPLTERILFGAFILASSACSPSSALSRRARAGSSTSSSSPSGPYSPSSRSA